MPIVVGVIVRRIKEKIYAQSGHLTLNPSDKVILETEHGVEYGTIFEKEKHIEKTKDVYIGKVIRKANDHDFKKLKDNENKNHQAHATVSKKIEDHELDMKLTCVQYTFDRSKLFIYYTSETRVDFRELIKDLGHILKTRIQMVQIGVRDESKMVGGIGTCGQQLCCQSFLKDFSSVTIDMAKDQDLSLNTAKLSGLCGRLMCCLAYEHQQYVDVKKTTPEIDSKVSTPNGAGILTNIDCVKETATVAFEETDKKTYSLNQIKILSNNQKNKNKQ